MFDPSKYSTRLIALKFAYFGQRYNGLEYHHGNTTPLPTVEEELWKALYKARLVFPTPNPLIQAGDPNWEGCEYSKCGRTDVGVSAFGQVVGIRVRSNRPVKRTEDATLQSTGLGQRGRTSEAPLIEQQTSLQSATVDSSIGNEGPTPGSPSSSSTAASPSFHHINDEIPYCQVLNRILPLDIRILAWCPNPPPDFSARFSCKERRYRYYFTQPAFPSNSGSPTLPTSSTIPESSTTEFKQGYLNIPAMRTAAHKFIGLHDFRNFCKTDASKQIENFERRMFHADIECLDLNHHPAVYAFTLHGTAFLWHQVRHMVAILFLIGQGLESPSLVDELLDVQKNPCKPHYEMADDAPLVLWDCIFPAKGSENREDALDWIYVGDYTGSETGIRKAGGGGNGRLVEDIWRVWRGRKIDEVLAGSLMDVIAGRGKHEQSEGKLGEGRPKGLEPRSQKIFRGGNSAKVGGQYIPIMQKPRMESVEVINAKYAKRKGFEPREEVREQGFRQLDIEKDKGLD